MVSALLDKVGFAWTMRIWALVCVFTLGPAVFFIRPRLPVERPPPGGPSFLQSMDLSFLANRTTLPLIMSCFTYSLGWFSTSVYLAVSVPTVFFSRPAVELTSPPPRRPTRPT